MTRFKLLKIVFALILGLLISESQARQNLVTALLTPVDTSIVSNGITFVLIKAGTYDMGDHFGFVDPDHPSDETPVHTVHVDSFYMAKTETSNQQFLNFLNAGSGYATYHWSTGDSTQSINVNTSGTYGVTVSNASGCSSCDSLVVQVGFHCLSGIVSYLDALVTQRRFVGLISGFASGNWVFDSPSVIINGTSPVVQNVKALCYGDVNGSYILLH